MKQLRKAFSFNKVYDKKYELKATNLPATLTLVK